MSISAVVPVWNGQALLARLLDTLDAQTIRADEVIAVDNGSSDGAPELARERGARVIPMGRNAGFAAAVNRGIQEARSEWIAVLNTDVELAPNYFEVCCAAGTSPGQQPSAADAAAAPVWFVTGKILEAAHPERIDATFDLTCRGATSWRAGAGRVDGPLFAKPRCIYSAPWTAALFRAELFRKVGLLEEQFESYLEDVDFGLRCAAQDLAGVYVPEAVAWHQGSATLGRWHPETVRRIARNQLFLAARHFPAEMRWQVLIAQALWGGVALRHGAVIPWARGIAEGLRAFRKSRDVRKVSSSSIEKQLRQNERTIYDLQAATSFDSYWKLYFLFTGGGAK